jgi:xylan 1,4-beta-xylosidase
MITLDTMVRVLLVVALAACTTAGAQVSFRVNLTSNTDVWPHYWEECVGSGHAALGLRPDWRAHLELCHDTLGFRRIRQHGLLDDDMGPVVTRSADDDSLQFNFTAIDMVS